jgi:hypothetical protein
VKRSFRACTARGRRSAASLPLTPCEISGLGEGETFARALVRRPSLVFVRHRNERRRSGDCNCSIRIFQRRASALPLLGERVGVRGNEANSNPRRTTTLGIVKLHDSPVVVQLGGARLLTRPP